MDLPLLLIQYNLAAALPPDLPLGDAVLTYVEQGRESTPASIPIVASSFGLFVKGYSGEGPVIAQNVSGEGVLSANQLTNAAHPGQFISLWGTGLGSAGEGAVEVEIGGKTVLPTYAGAVAGLPGDDQINVLIPADVPTGCYVPVIVRAGGTSSHTASISITDQGTVCNHPLNLSSDALATLDAGKSTGISLITFESDIREDQAHEMYWRQEYGLAEFANGDAAAVMAIAGFTTTNDMLPSCRLVDMLKSMSSAAEIQQTLVAALRRMRDNVHRGNSESVRIDAAIITSELDHLLDPKGTMREGPCAAMFVPRYS